MRPFLTPTRILWLVLAAIFTVFLIWYDYSAGPLTADEIDRYEALVREQGLEGTRVPYALREFASDDDGREFFMVNLEKARTEPMLPEGSLPDADPSEVAKTYSLPTGRMLLKRACHPVGLFLGRVNFIDYEGAPVWDELLLVRYRSRRDFLEIFTSPQTARVIQFKFVLIGQAHSWPTQTKFSLINARLPVVVVLLLVGLFAQLLIRRQTRVRARGASTS